MPCSMWYTPANVIALHEYLLLATWPYVVHRDITGGTWMRKNIKKDAAMAWHGMKQHHHKSLHSAQLPHDNFHAISMHSAEE